jgi:AraC family transcriptional regulator, regulatory protein of adaptative response / DNA-3-methyladenine glycosylase II
MDDEHCYRAVLSRDGRFDGAFFIAVTTTHIYCRPSCPAMTPKRPHMRFYPTAAAAQEAGFRACKRCRPDAAPGSPEWNARADLVARAMRLIGDGVVERDGVAGLARRLGYSERQLHRLVFTELGTGPLSLARAHRVQHARMLLETTDLPVTDVAWAAGFGSIRQFNDMVRHVFGLSPTELRRRATATANPTAPAGATLPSNWMAVRLSYRPPFDLAGVLDFLGRRAIPGVEAYDGRTYRRVLTLPQGLGVIEIAPSPPSVSHRTTGTNRPGFIDCQLRLDDARDFIAAVARVRRLLDLDADPVAVDAAFADDPVLAPLVEACPGRRVPGTVDGAELALRAVLGQQVSVAGARTLAARLVAEHGRPIAGSIPGLTHAFPGAETLAAADSDRFPLPAARRRAVQALTRGIAGGEIEVDVGADRDATEAALLALPGIGTWTASYVRMRALADPDVFLESDLGIRKVLAAGGHTNGHRPDTERWRPWRSYATAHLLGVLPTLPVRTPHKEPVLT